MKRYFFDIFISSFQDPLYILHGQKARYILHDHLPYVASCYHTGKFKFIKLIFDAVQNVNDRGMSKRNIIYYFLWNHHKVNYFNKNVLLYSCSKKRLNALKSRCCLGYFSCRNSSKELVSFLASRFPIVPLTSPCI